jgi:hypothetical protein
MQGVAGYERIAVPYPGGHLPGFRLQAKGKELATFVFHGGYDSFVEEFYAFLLPLTDLGFTVIAFDGPGQGGALRQGIIWITPGRSRPRQYSTTSISMPSIGSVPRAVATCRSAQPLSNRVLSTSSRCPRPIRASI